MYPASIEYFAGAGILAHEGTTFAFCYADCCARFEADPARFVAAGAP
jgi:YHS domain-containing protein